MSRPEALSFVEQGWHGLRDSSLKLDEIGIRVTTFIKGGLDPGVREMIRPSAGLKTIDMPRVVFRAILWVFYVWHSLRGRVRWILMDNRRTLKEFRAACRFFGQTPVFIQEEGNSYRFEVNGKIVSFDYFSTSISKRMARGGNMRE